MQSLNISTGTPRRSWLLTLALVIAAAAMVAPRPAAAGEFTINACQADAGNFSSGAFENFATRGMRWRRACNPLGPGLRGLVTANVVTGSRVAHGAQSAFVLNAPPGTAFSRLRWSGHAQRRDCRYALQMYAVRPDGSDATIKNVRANRHCPRPEGAQASSWPRPRAYDLGGATKIVQRVVCVGASSGQFCSGRGLNYMQTFTAEATVVDTSGPSVSIIADTPLARGEWVSGKQGLDYEATDNVGVKSASENLAGKRRHDPRLRLLAADSVSERPGPDRSRNRTHCQRRHPAAARRGSGCCRQHRRIGGGHRQDRQHATRALPRSASKAAKPGETATTSTSPGKTPPNPIGRRSPQRTTGSAGSAAANASATARGGTSIARLDNLTVPAPGEWELRLWREDAAGNQQPDNASAAGQAPLRPRTPAARLRSPYPTLTRRGCRCRSPTRSPGSAAAKSRSAEWARAPGRRCRRPRKTATS